MVDGVKIPISAELQTGDLQAAIAKFTQQLNAMGRSVAAANRVKFNPIDKASIEDLKKVEQGFAQLLRVQNDMRRRMRATGQADRGMFDLDWAAMYPGARARGQQMRTTFEAVTGHVFQPLGLPTPGAAPPPPRVPQAPSSFRAPPPRLPPIAPTPGARIGGALRQGLGGGLQAAGGFGGAVNTGLSAGAVGGFGAGMAGGFGALLAFGAASIVGGVRDKVGQAEQENIGYDTIKRQLGDVGVSFNYLKGSIRNASDAIDTTFEEAQKLASEFATLGNVSKDQAKNLAAFATVGGGFGRSFGMDPSMSNRFFGQMRGVGLTSSVDDTRRLAITMGETIAKSDAFAKAEEVLSAAASFASGQTRAGMVGANMGAWGGTMAGLVSSGTPGLDVTGAAGMLGRINSSIANGGQAGEAGQAFLYHAIGMPLGLDPIQAKMLQEQGMFGSGAATFRPGGVLSNFYGGHVGTAATSTTPNIQRIIADMRRQFGDNPSMLAAAFSKLTGLNMSQSAAFLSTPSAQMGATQGLLERNHVDIGSMNATGISSLVSIANGNHSTLLEHADSLRGRTGRDALSLDERKALDAAQGSGDDGRLRDVLIRLAADRDQELTDGGKTRASINDLNKTMQKMADALVEPMNTMRNAMVYLAGGGKKSARKINAEMQGIEETDVRDQASNEVSATTQAYAARISDLRIKSVNILRQRHPGMSPQEDADLVAQSNDLQGQARAIEADRDAEIAKINGARDAKLQALKTQYSATPAASAPIASNEVFKRMQVGMAETDRQLHLTPGTSAALIEAESSFRQRGHNEAGAAGIAQMQDATLAAIERRIGRKLDLNNPEDAVIAEREYLREGMAATGNEDDAVRYYHGGPNRAGWGPKGEAYLQSIKRYRGRYGDPVPSGYSAGMSGGRIDLGGTFHLIGPTGMPMAAPINITKTVGAPTPSGR